MNSGLITHRHPRKVKELILAGQIKYPKDPTAYLNVATYGGKLKMVSVARLA